MCASYGLDPRFTDADDLFAADAGILDALRSFARDNDGRTVRPTGRNLRNLSPIVRDDAGRRVVEEGWWGYLVDGAPAPFPSINTRSERLRDRSRTMPARAVVPATSWFEMQKPSRTWYRFTRSEPELFAMAAVTRAGRTADGSAYTCYSIVMRPAGDRLAAIHDRVPLLVPAVFLDDWLRSDASPRDLMDAARAASDAALERIGAVAMHGRP